MAIESKVPYVVSADVNQLMQGWSRKSGYLVPGPSFFSSLSSDRETMLREVLGAQIDVVTEAELTQGMNELALCTKYPLVSLDRIYLNGSLPVLEGFLDVTRAVDEDFNDLTGQKVYPRQDYPSIEEQLAPLASETEEPITLVDDVLFSGGGFVWLAERLAAINRPIKQAIFGIGIGKGLDAVHAIGVETMCVREYKAVIDEVCERDFLACVPLSGRTLICREGKYWGAPYFHPFGNPEKWASIPAENTEVFSRFCVGQSVRLWRQVEALSKTQISIDEVPRRIINLEPNQSLADALEEYILSH